MKPAMAATDSSPATAALSALLERVVETLGLEPGNAVWFSERVEPLRFRDGEALLSPDAAPPQHLFFVADGIVVAEPTPESTPLDSEVTLGGCVPLGAMLVGQATIRSFRARGDVVAGRLGKEDVMELVDRSPVFRRYCLNQLAERLQHNTRALRELQGQARLDQQPLGQPLSSLIRRDPITCPPQTPVREALRTMQENEIGAMLVADAERRPLGIFTLHDLLFRFALEGQDWGRPISDLMTPDVIALTPQSAAYEAMLEMASHAIRHVVVVDDGKVAGIVSERDLFTLQQASLRVIAGKIRGATRSEELVERAGDIQRLALSMVAQGQSSEQVTSFITSFNDLLYRRVIEIECSGIDLAGIRLCWIVMGSQGRFEQTLSTDQDNGIIFACDEPLTPDAVRERMLPVARRINERLDQCGFTLCKGNIMASNPGCLMSLEEWKQKFSAWAHRMDAPEILNATIFFDFRALMGDTTLTAALREHLHGVVSKNRFFVKRMVENALDNPPPLGIIRDFVVSHAEGEPNTLDLKVNGITHFVDAARIFSLTAGIAETNTLRRLRAVGRKWKLDPGRVEGWVDAFHYLQDIRLRAHFAQHHQGRPMSNRIDPDSLNNLDRRILKEAFRQGRDIQSLMEKYYQF